MPERDVLIAGALLHDVGKLLEYARNAEGRFVMSDYGLKLRHPVSGAMLAQKHGLPEHVLHIIAVHASEGNVTVTVAESALPEVISLSLRVGSLTLKVV